MAKKITMYSTKSQTISAVFDEFVRSRTADGVSAVTIKTYRAHFHSMSLHMDMERPLEVLTKRNASIISAPDSAVTVRVIPTDEELGIARRTFELV